MKNYVQKGENITVTAAAAAASGAGVLVGNLFGIAAGDAAIGEDLDLVTVGVFAMPKVATDAFTVTRIDQGEQTWLTLDPDRTELKTCTLAGTPVICIKIEEK